MKEVAAAFVNAQSKFAPLIRNAENPHRNSKYADLSSCVEAVIGALNESGIAVIQRTHDCENGVRVETLFVHNSGESISSGILHIPTSKIDAQGFGSALTYARRYSLMSACCIAAADDDGNAASEREEKVARPAKSKEEVMALVNDCTSSSMLKMVWAGLLPEERKLVKEEVKQAGEKLKGENK